MHNYKKLICENTTPVGETHKPSLFNSKPCFNSKLICFNSKPFSVPSVMNVKAVIGTYIMRTFLGHV